MRYSVRLVSWSGQLGCVHNQTMVSDKVFFTMVKPVYTLTEKVKEHLLHSKSSDMGDLGCFLKLCVYLLFCGREGMCAQVAAKTRRRHPSLWSWSYRQYVSLVLFFSGFVCLFLNMLRTNLGLLQEEHS